MAARTGISYACATVNFVIGCTPVGPGCDGCYASAFAFQKWRIVFEAGGERRPTKVAFQDPLRWHAARMAGKSTMTIAGEQVLLPLWIFACSLSDFFDNEWPDGLRDRAWAIIRNTPSLRWMLFTKRIGNVPKMLPADWGDGSDYQHVGIVATTVNQAELDRDADKIRRVKYDFGVKWTGLSIEPQLEMIDINGILPDVDLVISGGESKQTGHLPRPYDLAWPRSLLRQCRSASRPVPFWQKQMGDAPFDFGKPLSFPGKGDDPQYWPLDLRVQERPRIYDEQAQPAPYRCAETSDLFGGAA
ncbi:DUF5131 family protein [Rhodopseudomonas sp. BR0C11]|uniref:DUF5131 family protein n=1 Tax=Rhodopseudomonas sp. BR0C11 TaxID=2269370 RepID=UPI0013DFA8F5|nr:DUF5131 family protein [Rhodopseudomonas sp. BR0C11]NEV75527.1 DUF5131 family protein [Rhodopseudomonas sp. BR0C11]